MGTQGYLAPQFSGTKQWFVPGENSGHASKQQMSSFQEGKFGVKYPDAGWSKCLNLELRYIAKLSRAVNGSCFLHILTHAGIRLTKLM